MWEYAEDVVVVERMQQHGIPPFVMAYAVIVAFLLAGALLGS
jgi:hypothetical protein